MRLTAGSPGPYAPRCTRISRRRTADGHQLLQALCYLYWLGSCTQALLTDRRRRTRGSCDRPVSQHAKRHVCERELNGQCARRPSGCDWQPPTSIHRPYWMQNKACLILRSKSVSTAYPGARIRIIASKYQNCTRLLSFFSLLFPCILLSRYCRGRQRMWLPG